MDDYVAQVERETIQLIERGESMGQAWLSGFAGIAEQIAPYIPELPATPFATMMPKPADVVKASFDVIDRLLDATRKLAEGSVEAIAPVTSALMPWTNGKASKRSERKSASAANREAA
jgi:hypothetical protein